jgi:protein-arginine kinase activator protein McsA
MKYLKIFEDFNNKRFSVGQKVIALNDSKLKNHQPRIKGNIYVIKSVIYCHNCGAQYLNFGYKSNLDTSDFGKCACGAKTHAKGLFWSNSKNYAPLDDIEEILRTAVEEEDYELATLLRDIMELNKIEQE